MLPGNRSVSDVDEGGESQPQNQNRLCVWPLLLSHQNVKDFLPLQ
jgi:hypothetical protein